MNRRIGRFFFEIYLKYAVYRTYFTGTVFADCLKWHFSISSEEVNFFVFIFVLRLFLGVIHSKNRILQFLVL